MQTTSNDARRFAPDAGDYMTTAEAAKYRRLAVTTLRHERAEGKGPAYIKSGRRVLYRRADIDAYLTAHIVEPKGKARPDA